MTYTWYICDDGTLEFEIIEKIGNQTLLLAAQELHHTSDTYYWNLWLTLANKRSQRAFNEEHILLTGVNPFLTYKVAIRLLQYLEKNVCKEYKQYNHQFIAHWVDNRRRDAYIKVLSKFGYKIGQYKGQKRLIKTIKKG